MASLPRPSRPSLTVPPSGPLPSLPAANKKPSPGSSSATSPAASTSVSPSGIPKTPRNVSSSSIPTSGPATPASAGASSGPSAAKTLRKTASYNVFPKAPSSSRPPSQHSTVSTATTPRTSQRASSLYNNTPSRTQSLNTNRASALNGPALAKSVPITPSIGAEDPILEHASEHIDSRGRPQSTGGKDKGNVIISVRVRPEGQPNDSSAAAAASAGEWMVDGRQSLVSYRGKEGGEYYYDNVFAAHDKNAKVYDASAKRLVRRVMEGYHGTVFAYGMTGTGKTYSMQGTATSPGVIPLAITDIFSFIRETPQREFLLRVSYLEIYNERIHDLLSAPAQAAGPGPVQQEEIKLREDSKRGVYATPLKEEIVQSPTQLLRVIARGDHSRRTSSTQFNARSSRSHAVVQIVVESRERNTGGGNASANDSKRSGIVPGGVRVSTLSLIDLAGSERAAESKERRAEGAHINKSLLTLGTVISKLSGSKDKSGQPTDKEGKHLPYRDSKLTRLLQPALSGGSLISILCTIQIGSANSAAIAGTHTIETLNTLKFAARARNNIVSHAKKAEESHANIGDAGSRALLDRYRIEILELRKQLESQKGENEKTKVEEDEKQKQADEEARHEEQMLEMQLARTALKERIEHLNRLILSSKSMGVNNRSFSSLSLAHPRQSGVGSVKSLRSSAGSALSSTNDLGRKVSQSSIESSASTLKDVPTNNASQTPPDSSPPPEEDDEDTVGELGDGNASLNTQVRNLQADLNDKNRYITTLEKRLLQARRTSRSRVSLTFSNRPSSTIPEDDTEGFDAIIRDKDAEIADLRARLDDKERMVAALKSAARKRDTADSRPSSVAPSVVAGERNSPRASLTSVHDLPNGGPTRTSSGSIRSVSANEGRRSSLNTPPSSLSKMTSISQTMRSESPATPEARMMSLAGGSPQRQVKRNHGVDEMTRMLDEMIRQKVEAGGGTINKPLPRRPNSQQIPSSSPVAQALAATPQQEQRAASAVDVRSENERVRSPVNGHATVSNGKPTPAPINVDQTPTIPKSPTSATRPKANPSIDGGKLSGWESQISRRRSLKKEREQGGSGGTHSASNSNGHVQTPTTPNQNGFSISSPSTTIQSSPTVPSRSPTDDRPMTAEKMPPLPTEYRTEMNGGSGRPSRDLLRVEDITRDRDISPGSEGTAILDEVQESSHSKRNSTVGLGIEAR